MDEGKTMDEVTKMKTETPIQLYTGIEFTCNN